MRKMNMVKLKLTILTVAVSATALVTACASAQDRVCDASAQRHRELAADEAREAEAHTWRGPVQTSPNRHHQERAEQHRERAQRHEQAAREREARGNLACIPED
jgi:hypothetical protein